MQVHKDSYIFYINNFQLVYFIISWEVSQFSQIFFINHSVLKQVYLIIMILCWVVDWQRWPAWEPYVDSVDICQFIPVTSWCVERGFILKWHMPSQSQHLVTKFICGSQLFNIVLHDYEVVVVALKCCR